jgi:hypothetical protein
VHPMDPFITIHGSRVYTGYIDFEAKHLFFYFFESRNDPDRDDVIFWTDGGQSLDFLRCWFFIALMAQF